MGEKRTYTAPSYADARALFNRALESEKGIMVVYETKKEAWNMHQKLNKVRYQAKKESRKMYDEEHQQYGTSPWDEFCISEVLSNTDTPEGETKLFIRSGEAVVENLHIINL